MLAIDRKNKIISEYEKAIKVQKNKIENDSAFFNNRIKKLEQFNTILKEKLLESMTQVERLSDSFPGRKSLPVVLKNKEEIVKPERREFLIANHFNITVEPKIVEEIVKMDQGVQSETVHPVYKIDQSTQSIAEKPIEKVEQSVQSDLVDIDSMTSQL